MKNYLQENYLEATKSDQLRVVLLRIAWRKAGRHEFEDLGISIHACYQAVNDLKVDLLTVRIEEL